jgi:uncharacterized repeat protein (TIGR02543 family)
MTITGTGFVYKDIDGDSSYSSTKDSLYAGIDVGLYAYENDAWSDTYIDKSTTDKNGVYGFTNVAAGTYRVAPIVAFPYETEPSQAFDVVQGQHTSVSYPLHVNAKVSLRVNFVNQNTKKVGTDIEIYGAKSGYLYDLSQPVVVSALLASSASSRTNVAVPEFQYYGISGANTQSATFDFDKPITWSNTITFKLEGKRFVVTYDGNGATKGAVPNSDTVVYPDTHIKSLPTAPEKDGYAFKGWRLADGKAFTNTSEILTNVTVTAQWEINTYTVRFIDHDGTVLSTQKVEHGGNSTAPSNPTRTGYEFTGWDKSFEHVTGDIDVHAAYTAIPAPASTPERPTPEAAPETETETTETTVTTAAVANSIPETETTITQNPNPDPNSIELIEEQGLGGPRVVDQQKLAEISVEQGIPILGIGDSGVPLFGPAGYGCWALADLLLSAAALVILMFAIPRALLRRRSGGLHVRIGFGVGTIVLAIASAAVFLSTQDMSMPMVMLDSWSILLAIALAAEIVCVKLTLPKTKARIDAI